MSAVSSRSRTKKVDPLSKKIPENPKYKDVKATVDTGASISRYMAKIEEINKYYRYKKDELFKRMKPTTFTQLVIQVSQFNDLVTDEQIPPTPIPSSRSDRGDWLGTERENNQCDTEVQKIQDGYQSPAPSIALTEGDFGAPKSDLDTSRSTLQSVTRGIGEMDVSGPPKPPDNTFVDDTFPYLLLDVRDADAYNQCHIITAINYPKAMISRATNYFTKEILAYKNTPGKIIIVYDEDEKLAQVVTSTMVERGIDNVFMLSGGLKKAAALFKDSFITGTLPESISGVRNKEIQPATQKQFTREDIDRLTIYMDSAQKDRSLGSRLSNASTTASRGPSRKSIGSSMSKASDISSRPAFR